MNEEQIQAIVKLLTDKNFLIQTIETERSTYILKDSPVKMAHDGKITIRIEGFLNPEE